MKKYLLLALFPCMVLADRIHPERYYQELWCTGKGETEYILPDRTRVDCLTEKYAVETDFANKWAESVGQALHYSYMTGKEPAILIIIENPEKDWKYLPRLYGAILESGRNIRVFYIED